MFHARALDNERQIVLLPPRAIMYKCLDFSLSWEPAVLDSSTWPSETLAGAVAMFFSGSWDLSVSDIFKVVAEVTSLFQLEQTLTRSN